MRLQVLAALSFAFSVISASPLPSFCQFALLDALCHRTPSSISIHNAIGVPTENGVIRYVAKYATAKRWSPAKMSTSWISPNKSNPATLPPLCPQSGVDLSQVSEDCLYVILYVPPTAKKTPGGVPTMVWIHGGSFIIGGATGAGLDGSNLAVATNSIVAVVQYRLGTLGLLPPSADKKTNNLALQDLITALTFLRSVLPNFGGTPGTPKLTVAGQSSGASLIRGLLGTPAAWPLFNNAVLHSDTVAYGFLTPGAFAVLREAWINELGCSSTGNCAETMDLETLLNHQDNLVNVAPSLGPEYYFSSPIRPTTDDSLIYTFTNASAFPPASNMKPIVVTTVKDEGNPSIFSFFPNSDGLLSQDVFEEFMVENIGQTRTDEVLESPFYSFNASVDLRTVLSTITTDGIWRCPGYALTRSWAAHGGAKQYTGLFTVGITYPPNQGIPECTQPGAVCHQDDIEVLFGTGPTPIPLTQEIQQRYSSFIRTNIPNAEGYPTWQLTTETDTKTLDLGGNASIPVGACIPTFWGDEVLFNYQVNHE